MELAALQALDLQAALDGGAKDSGTGSGELARSGLHTLALPQYGLNNLAYLQRDWCTEAPDTSLSVVVRLLRGRMAGRRVLVLGAGFGRLAAEIENLGAEVHAIELCYSYAAIFARLRNGPLRFWVTNYGTPTCANSLVGEFTADCGSLRTSACGVSYAVADVQRIPLPDRSQDAILSVYFSDVLPLYTWIGEVTRVLRPGGVFCHVGPLHYHFANPVWSLAPDEFAMYLERLGFAVEVHDDVRVPFHTGAARSYAITHQASVLVARRPT